MRVALALALLAATADASPNTSLDDPVYADLARLRAEGRLGPFAGGLQPLTDARIHDLLLAAGETDDRFAPLDGWWIAVDRVAAETAFYRDEARPYSTPLRPRDLAGSIDLPCERQEGRPCGHGATLLSELDATTGVGRIAAAGVRLRVQRTPRASGFDVDRLYASVELGLVTAELGRDVLVLGPSSRTQLGWGDHAAPLEHVRLSTTRPLEIADGLRGSLLYVVGRMRDPQTYPGTLVTIARGQLDIAGSVELGMMQLLQLGGDGAPGFGVWDFVREHLTRRDASAGPTDSSNRRVGFDFAAHIAGLHGARLYYQIVFEDWRQQFVDAIRYDADHLFGADVARHGLVFEIMKTGVRSQEHVPRVTGFTNAGRVVGSALGPDAIAVFASKRIALGRLGLVPWLEVARLSSDTYTFVTEGGISRATDGVAERRYRVGAQLQIHLRPDLRVDAEATYEHVSAFAFDPAAHRDNLGATIALVWSPGDALRTRVIRRP